jgi:Tfp pilus assembly PilM family ATPase
MATQPEKKIETQEKRVERIKARVDAEKAQDIDNKIKAAKKAGLTAEALDLYTKALNEKQSLTLVPAGKVPNEDAGNHLVEVELVDGKPVEINGMVVVRHK